jgi:hypothetical protein
MLRSAALCCGPRCVGVVLTGTLGGDTSRYTYTNEPVSGASA